MYFVVANADIIEMCDSYEDALRVVEWLEFADMECGIYMQDFYKIVEE